MSCAPPPGHALTHARKAKGWTRVELAQRIVLLQAQQGSAVRGVDAGGLAQLEAGRHRLRLDQAMLIAAALAVDVSVLATGQVCARTESKGTGEHDV